MARPLRIEYPGVVYHVVVGATIVRTFSKTIATASGTLDKLVYYCELKEVSLLCYCLLSNHIHLLLETPQRNLSKMMQPFQTSYVGAHWRDIL